MDFNAPSDLGWQALKYAARRLPDPERDSFEEQLMDDQAVREAVAQAVELSHTVAALHGGALLQEVVAEPAVAVAESPKRSRSGLIAACIALAACLAFVLFVRTGDRTPSALEVSQNKDTLSLVWADLHNNSDLDPLPLEPTSNEPALASEEHVAPDVVDLDGIVPDWLMIGVSKESRLP